MNSMNDSGDCQDVESNLWWKIVSRFQSSCVAQAATKDCRLTHGINLDYRKTFLELNFLHLIHPEIVLTELNLTTCEETVKQSLKQGRTKTSHTSEDRSCDDSEFSFIAQPRETLLTHVIHLDYRRTFFGHQVSTFDSPRDLPQRISSDDVQRNREADPEARRTKNTLTSEDRLNQGTIPMPTFGDETVDYEFCNTGGITAELYSRTAKSANIGIAIRQILNPQSHAHTSPSLSSVVLIVFFLLNEWAGSVRSFGAAMNRASVASRSRPLASPVLKLRSLSVLLDDVPYQIPPTSSSWWSRSCSLHPRHRRSSRNTTQRWVPFDDPLHPHQSLTCIHDTSSIESCCFFVNLSRKHGHSPPWSISGKTSSRTLNRLETIVQPNTKSTVCALLADASIR